VATKKTSAQKKVVSPTETLVYVRVEETPVIPAPADITYDTIAVGDTVKSLDFPDDPAKDDTCFVEGVVTNIIQGRDCPRYEIRVSRRVFGRKVMEIEEVAEPVLIYPPVNGTPTFLGGVCHGVHKLS
jgi:hypothetical protein